MATLYLKDFAQLNTFKDINATTWQLAYDKDFKEIFFEDSMDTEHIYNVSIGLHPSFVRNKDKPLYARVKVHYLADNNRVVDSDWFVLKENRDMTDNLVLKRNGFSIGFINREDDNFKILTVEEFIKEKNKKED